MSKKNKKLKLAIYGCSFASVTMGPDHLLDQAWPNLFKEKYSVDIYSAPGSSVFYSYKKFLETYINYDKIIFSQTSSGRWFNPIMIDGFDRYFSHINQVLMAKKAIQEESLVVDIKTIKTLDALEGYFLYLEDASTSHAIDQALLHHIKSLRKDAIIIPIHFWRKVHSDFMKKLKSKWVNLWRIDGFRFEEINLVNHFPVEYHQEFYRMIDDSLKQESFNHIQLENDVAVNNPFEYYYEEKSI